MFYAVLTWLFRGISPLLEKIGIAEVSGTTALIIRNIPVALFMLVMVWTPSIKHELRSLSTKGWVALLASGVLTAWLARWTYFIGLKKMQDNLLVFMGIVSSYLIITMILEQIVLNRKLLISNYTVGIIKCVTLIGWRGFVGTSLCILGIVLLESRHLH